VEADCSEPQFFDVPLAKVQKVMTAGATQNIDYILNLLFTSDRDIDDVMSFPQGLFMSVQGDAFVSR
jgi:hypothetical protein